MVIFSEILMSKWLFQHYIVCFHHTNFLSSFLKNNFEEIFRDQSCKDKFLLQTLESNIFDSIVIAFI